MPVGYTYQFTFGGVNGTDAFDTWQTGARFYSPTEWGSNIPGLPSLSDLSTFYTNVLGPKFSSSDMPISSKCRLLWCKVALLRPDGKYYADAVAYEGAGMMGYGSTYALAPQDSVVVSLWSGSRLGTGNHGRMYLPWASAALDTTGHITSPATSTVCGAMKIVLNGMQTVLRAQQDASDATLCIVPSNRSASPKPVNYIRVGNVVDTQRRRRNRIQETYFKVVFP